MSRQAVGLIVFSLFYTYFYNIESLKNRAIHDKGGKQYKNNKTMKTNENETLVQLNHIKIIIKETIKFKKIINNVYCFLFRSFFLIYSLS